MKFKHIDLTEFQVKFDAKGAATIEGYGSIFGNRDNQDDIVMPGAFKSSLQISLPVMLYQHKSDKIPGIWTKGAEDSRGLHLQGHTIDTTLGRDVAEEIRSGAIKGLSIGYSVKQGGSSYDKGARLLKDLDLFETSLVTFPANEQANITSVKAALANIDTAADLIEQVMTGMKSGAAQEDILQMLINAMNLLEDPTGEDDTEKSMELTPRSIERILRGAGCSKRDARRIVAEGFNTERCDADLELMRDLKSSLTTLKG